MTNTETTPSVYVGTYAKYNNGSIEGKWLNLTDYSNIEEFYEACRELHNDEEDPEFMFQDYEGIPKEHIDESWINEKIYEELPALAIPEILEKIEALYDDELISLHNQYCNNAGYPDDYIYIFDEDFFEMFFEGRPMEAARATAFGKVNWSDTYIKFDGYGNLESISDRDISRHDVDKDAIAAHILENRQDYDI
jgi:hypothetical protein